MIVALVAVSLFVGEFGGWQAPNGVYHVSMYEKINTCQKEPEEEAFKSIFIFTRDKKKMFLSGPVFISGYAKHGKVKGSYVVRNRIIILEDVEVTTITNITYNNGATIMGTVRSMAKTLGAKVPCVVKWELYGVK